jgi:putative Holliday junction resolvase
VIQRQGESYALNRLKELLSDREVEYFVVGIPLRRNGKLMEEGSDILCYIESLRTYFGRDVITWDESFTTVEAEDALISSGVDRDGRKKVVDKVAAQIILQSYLDHKHNT